MNNLEVLNEVVTMTSLEVCNLVNEFRKIEGNKKEKRHDHFLESIREEIKKLEEANIKIGVPNIWESSYINKQNKQQPCYIMNKQWKKKYASVINLVTK